MISYPLNLCTLKLYVLSKQKKTAYSWWHAMQLALCVIDPVSSAVLKEFNNGYIPLIIYILNPSLIVALLHIMKNDWKYILSLDTYYVVYSKFRVHDRRNNYYIHTSQNICLVVFAGNWIQSCTFAIITERCISLSLRDHSNIM